MLNNYKCEQTMNKIDSSMCLAYCPKPKKSKPSDDNSDVDESSTITTTTTNWAHLPSIVLHEIFNLLNRNDRLNASAVCKNWRHNLFHPKWWPTINFDIEYGNLEKSRFFTLNFGKIVTNATIKVNTLNTECTDEFITLLEILNDNNNLKELIIEPTHCYFNISRNGKQIRNYDISYVIEMLKGCVGNLVKFSIGCVEDFSYTLDEYLMIMSEKQPEKVTHLGLATVKDTPNSYESSYFTPELITPFTKLKILSVDYEEISDEFLKCLDTTIELERLIVHLHGIRKGHPGTTNAAWQKFNETHPECELRLTVIHAYNEISKLHETVLKLCMPLTHLKVFFCENLNLSVLECMYSYYRRTLKSVIWVDSLSNTKKSWLLTTRLYHNTPDPLILMSWLCEQLEELIFYGYKYNEDNLIAIARLRDDKLKKLEFAADDVIESYFNNNSDCPTLLSEGKLKQRWAPKHTSDLHPVLLNPIAGDSDEYLLPIVLADLH